MQFEVGLLGCLIADFGIKYSCFLLVLVLFGFIGINRWEFDGLCGEKFFVTYGFT